MPRDSSGNYTLPAGNPVVTGTTILSTWANGTMPDIGTELTNSLDRSGRGGMTAALKVLDGTVAAPGLSFQSEITTGFYRAAAGDLRISVLNRDIVKFLQTGVSILAPTAGAALTILGLGGATTLIVSEAAIPKIALTTSVERAYLQYTEATSVLLLDSDGSLTLATNNTPHLTISSNGNVAIPVPASGSNLTITAIATGTAISLTDATRNGAINFVAGGLQFGTSSAHSLELYTGGSTRLTFAAGGNATFAAASVVTAAGGFVGPLTGNVTGNASGSSGSTTGNAATATALQTARAINGTNFDGTAAITVTAAAGTLTGATLNASVTASSLTSIGNATVLDSVGGAFSIGYRGLPAASVTTGAFAASDAGKCVYATAGVTIPNATMTTNDAVVIQNTTGGALTITKTITTAYNTGTGAALGATFTLNARGRCSIVFTSNVECYVSGNIS